MGEESCSYRTMPIGSSLIHVVNKLHEITSPFVSGELSRISLPEVAVVGSQSSGKSSVLEALVGRDFLPRGCEICTRRPLRLMLEHRSCSLSDDGGDWGEFAHLPDKRFYDFNEILAEIQAETIREVGYKKNISVKEIRLKISSPNVLDMTLIDLPGITKVPVGDQPSDIETVIRRLIMKYISKSNCIILAVSPANSDLATSDALQIAKEADPQGFRTIGVITKLDIMDRGTNACNFLNGKCFPLRLGYVGVVNRSQEDIYNKRTIQEAFAYERRFFHEHPEYNSLSNHCGIPQLAKKLNQILEQHIRTTLPSLKGELKSYKDLVQKELQTYGELAELQMEKGTILLNLLKRFCEEFSSIADGKNEEILTKQLSGGARIRYIFESVFVKTLEALDPCEDLSDEEIQTAIQNASGLRNSLFVPEVPFEALVRRQIARLLDPCLQCVNLVHDELLEMSRAAESATSLRFPNLRKRIHELVHKFLQKGTLPAERMIENLIEIEIDYINYSHPNFLGGDNAVELAIQLLQSPQIASMNFSMPYIAGLLRQILARDNYALVHVLFSNMSKICEKISQLDVNKIQGSKDSSDPDKVIGAPQNQGNQTAVKIDRPAVDGANSSGRTWGIPSILSGIAKMREGRVGSYTDQVVQKAQQVQSKIKLTKLPTTIMPEITDQDKKEIIVTKLLLQSYFDIVRKTIQDLVPKTIMHFLVNHMKRNLHTTLVRELYKESLFKELLQEEEETAARRERAQELLHAVQEAIQTLDEVGSDAFRSSKSH